MNVIRIDRQKHESFLADQRFDPITKELIRVGDEVVICGKCKDIYLKDIWIHSLKGVHCNQKETLSNLPEVNNYFKRFNLIDTLNDVNKVVTNINFKLCTIDSVILLNKIFCAKDQIIFNFKIEHKNIIKININFKYVYLNQCKLITQPTGIQTIVFTSYLNTDGILLNSKRNTKIGINVFARDSKVQNIQLAKIFYRLLVELINHCQNTKN